MNEVLATLPCRDETNRVLVRRQLFKGKVRCDIRIFFRPEGGTEFVPTGKGVSFAIDTVPELIEALQRLAA
jgi:hypothetical protein